jgi:predicted heme/steroid binding protein
VDERTFTRGQLSEFNGKEGRPAYVAYKGKVYDVTGSFQWKEGNHWVIHEAGTDLTREMEDAPHFDDVFAGFMIIGTLVTE